MYPNPFDYHRAGTVAEAISLLQELGDDAKIVAGGHSLLPTMKLRLASPAHLIDITGIAGLDQVTAWSAVAASINNAGPGLGEVSTTFRDVNDAAKWICAAAMLLGRLEVFTLILLVTPDFWRK